jgi:cell division protein FtsW
MPIERLLLCLFALILVGVGIVMIYNSTAIQASEQKQYGGSSNYFLTRQLVCFGIGIVVFLVTAVLNYRYLIHLGPWLLFGSIILLSLVFSQYGVEVNGARRWVSFMGVRVQPAEAANYSTILFLVYMLMRKQRKVDRFFTSYVPMILGAGLVMFLIVMQPNLSVTILIGGTTMILLFIGGARPSHIIGTIIAALPFLGVIIWKSDYLWRRILVWLNPFDYEGAGGLQPVESMTALGVGNWLGVGLGMSRQKLYFLPYCHNDFIGAIIGEETGFVGMSVLILLYLALTACGITIAFKIKDLGGYLLASGITVLIALQALIHLGVVTASIPPTGINLPFISFGGSNLIMNCAGIGMLVSISRRTELQPREKFTVQGGI